jgi:hypothetical protein
MVMALPIAPPIILPGKQTLTCFMITFFGLNALGSPRATRIVTTLTADKVATELKDADTDLVELPSCHSKRSLYNSYLAEMGWECKCWRYSKMHGFIFSMNPSESIHTLGCCGNQTAVATTHWFLVQILQLIVCLVDK